MHDDKESSYKWHESQFLCKGLQIDMRWYPLPQTYPKKIIQTILFDWVLLDDAEKFDAKCSEELLVQFFANRVNGPHM